MRKYHTYATINFVIILMLVPSFAKAYGGNFNEPDNFRGIKWGTSENNLNGFILYQEHRDQTVYTRKNDSMKMGGANVGKILYIFTQGAFTGVMIKFQNSNNAIELRKLLFEMYGPILSDLSEKTKYSEQYHWIGETVSIIFTYDKGSEEGDIVFIYKL